MTNLEFLRRRKGLMQKDLAKQIGIHPTHLSRIEGAYLTRVPDYVEKRLMEVFGPEWTFRRLMESPPDLIPDSSGDRT